ncbi:WXG100 family type VII secretion target [Amycolatopsis sp. H20-H5]|uniref:WXG100 family type VII secretion target n=1 Tax=Amycolatopsis sp. H20-H5 TaxID=3046309 RepID=UPI002DBD9AEB|nr:WXG100 family type VII secretion target [Amycolatopsis sp. H20-H5]MEC3978330.1 WXG100 family type VII secretion target [Amycolatopsis sp. H20-H5]
MVDVSGPVRSILAGYRELLVEYQRRVTGDPGALSAAAQRCVAQAATVSGKGEEIARSATGLHADWDGAAYTAFATAAGKLGEELGETATELRDKSQRLSTAAGALRSAKASVDAILKQFDQYSAQLVSQARTADASAVNAFISAAREYGEGAAEAAKETADALDDALAELFPPEGAGRLEHELGKRGTGPLHWVNGEPLNGSKRQRKSPSWFANSQWRKLTWDGLQGTRAPKAANTPFGRPEAEGFRDKAWNNTEITYWKTKHEQDGLTPGYDAKLSSQGWDLKATGHAELGLHGELGDKKEWGPAEISGKVSGFVGGEVTGAVQAGAHGVGAHLNAFVGGKVEGEVAADVAGLGVGANGTLQYGLGAQLDGQAVYDAGHIKVNFKAGVAFGLGAGVGAKIDIDLPKMAHTAEEYGGAAYDAVSHAATGAADAVGAAWDDAAQYAGSW